MGRKYQAYSEYKDSGVEWLGDVPNHWVVTRLAYVFTKSNAGEVIDKTYWGDGQELLYTCNRTPLLSDYFEFPEEKRTGINDLLLTRNGTPYVHKPKVNSIYSNVVQRISLTDEYDRDYLSYCLSNSAANLKGYGVSIESLNFENWKSLSFGSPSKQEQEKIVRFLDHETAKIDTLIEKQQQLIKLLKEKRQAVISHAVTNGLNPDAPMRDSGVEWLGEVPAHWVVRRLKHTAALQSGIPKGKDLTGKPNIEVPMLRVANVQDGYLDLNDVHKMSIEPDQLERYSLEYGDVLMNEGGDNDKLGRGAVWRSEIETCIHQNHVFAIRPHSIEPEWLDLLTRASYAKFYFFMVAKQSTNLASISSTNIKETPLVIPPKEERREIMDYVFAKIEAFELIEKRCSDQITLMQERRTAIISAAVTGKIDVRNLNASEQNNKEDAA